MQKPQTRQLHLHQISTLDKCIDPCRVVAARSWEEAESEKGCWSVGLCLEPVEESTPRESSPALQAHCAHLEGNALKLQLVCGVNHTFIQQSSECAYSLILLAASSLYPDSPPPTSPVAHPKWSLPHVSGPPLLQTSGPANRLRLAQSRPFLQFHRKPVEFVLISSQGKPAQAE